MWVLLPWLKGSLLFLDAVEIRDMNYNDGDDRLMGILLQIL